MKLPKTLAGWVVDGRVVGKAGVTADRAVWLLGDSAFIQLDDWGIVERVWEDQELFGYVYGGSCSKVAFESAEGTAMRRVWSHRQAVLRVRQLRMHWAEGLRLGWGLVVCGLGDSRWVRRVAGEMVAIVATDERYDAWARAGRPLAGLDLARRRAAGAEATAEVETRYRNVVFERRMSAHFEDFGVAPTSNERQAFAKALGLMWPWALGLAVRLGTTGVVVDVPQLGFARLGVEVPTVEVEVAGAARARRLDAGLGGIGRTEKLAKWLVRQLASLIKAEPMVGLFEALGYRLSGEGLLGTLLPDWSGRLAGLILLAKLLGEEGPPANVVGKALEVVGKPIFEAAGLLESADVTWQEGGFGCEMKLVDRVRRAGVERLASAALAKGCHGARSGNAPQSALALATVGRSPRGRTVYRDFLRSRLGVEDRSFWDGIEKAGGCVVTDALSGGQQLVSLYDGLASAYLSSLGLRDDFEGPFTKLMADRGDEDPVSLEEMATLKEAVTAASVWALRQILREGHRWLGLSGPYRRTLASAFRRFEDLVVNYPMTGVWKVGGRDVLGLEPLVEGKPLKVNAYLGALRGDDRFFGASRSERWHERAGGPEFPMTPPPALGTTPWVLFGPRTPQQYLKEGGFFRRQDGQWERRDGTGGAVFPGLRSEQEARAVGHIITLLGGGVLRHRRVILMTHVAQQTEGKLPLRFVPWVPLGMGDVGGYASAVLSMGGAPLGSKLLSSPTADEVKLWTWGRLRAHWAYVGRYPSLWRAHDLFDLVSMMVRARECLPKGESPITQKPFSSGPGKGVIAGDVAKKIWVMCSSLFPKS